MPNTVRVEWPKLHVTVERYVYQVPSDTNPRIAYRVDLMANKGGGKCACTDHNTRRQPAIDRGEPLFTSATLCKHVRTAQEYFKREMLLGLAQIENGER